MIEDTPTKKSLIWTAESTHPELCKTLKEGLRTVTDPELGMDVIQLGLIRDVVIEPDHVTLKMILTTPYCPYGPSMLENTRARAEQVVNRTTKVEFGLEPWDFSMMEDGVMPDWSM